VVTPPADRLFASWPTVALFLSLAFPSCHPPGVPRFKTLAQARVTERTAGEKQMQTPVKGKEQVNMKSKLSVSHNQLMQAQV